MAVLDVIVGYVRGLKGDTGETGATGATGPGATVSVGTVTTTTYGNPAQVTNSGTATDAVLNFVIPQGAPGEEVTDVSSLTLDSVTSTAASFPIPAVGEVMSVIMGKIIKFFGDTVTALNAKLNRSDVTTSLGVTTTGQALDATAGKTLNDSISALNDSLTVSYVGNIESAITGATPSISNIVRVGKSVNFGLRFGSLNYSSTSRTTIATIPSDFRPLGQRFCMGYLTISSTRYPAMFLIYADGTIRYDPFSSGTVVQIEVCGSYMIGD